MNDIRTAEAADKAGKCARCERPLKNPASVKAGMGPVCAGKAVRGSGELLADTPVLMDVGPVEEVGLVCRRMADGRLAANVPHVVVYHSPCGFDVGYAGSGPAELALNVLHRLLPPLKHYFMEVRGAHVSVDAWRLHQAFKFRFITPMARDGGHVSLEDMRSWIALRLAEAA